LRWIHHFATDCSNRYNSTMQFATRPRIGVQPVALATTKALIFSVLLVKCFLEFYWGNYRSSIDFQINYKTRPVLCTRRKRRRIDTTGRSVIILKVDTTVDNFPIFTSVPHRLTVRVTFIYLIFYCTTA
jgi:hypothetical protein